jgi:hypothetical protein
MIVRYPCNRPAVFPRIFCSSAPFSFSAQRRQIPVIMACTCLPSCMNGRVTTKASGILRAWNEVSQSRHRNRCGFGRLDISTRASPRHIRFRANRTSSRLRRMTESETRVGQRPACVPRAATSIQNISVSHRPKVLWRKTGAHRPAQTAADGMIEGNSVGERSCDEFASCQPSVSSQSPPHALSYTRFSRSFRFGMSFSVLAPS